MTSNEYSDTYPVSEKTPTISSSAANSRRNSDDNNIHSNHNSPEINPFEDPESDMYAYAASGGGLF